MEDIRIARNSSFTYRVWNLGITDPNPSVVVPADPLRTELTFDVLTGNDVIFYFGGFDNEKIVWRTFGTTTFWRRFSIHEFGPLIYLPVWALATAGNGQVCASTLRLNQE